MGGPSARGEPKKRKLDGAEQTPTQKAIAMLAALDLTFSGVPETLASDLISSLRPGIGLLGTAEEEEAYHASYLEKESNDAATGAS